METITPSDTNRTRPGELNMSRRRLKSLYKSGWLWYEKHFHRTLFIHINKTGGTSITRALRKPFEHLTALEKRSQVGEIVWQEKFTFSFVRNPYDKVVSLYHFRVKTNQTGLADDKLDFNNWVNLVFRQKDPGYYNKPKMFMPCTDWLTDQGGKLLVDFVGRFERMEEDFKTVLKKAGLKPTSLPHLKKSSRGDFNDYYSAESKTIVREWFAKDFERFEYPE